MTRINLHGARRSHAAFEDDTLRRRCHSHSTCHLRYLRTSSNTSARVCATIATTARISLTPTTLMTGSRHTLEGGTASVVRPLGTSNSDRVPEIPVPPISPRSRPSTGSRIARLVTRSLGQKLPRSAIKCHGFRARFMVGSSRSISSCDHMSRSHRRVRPPDASSRNESPGT